MKDRFTIAFCIIATMGLFAVLGIVTNPAGYHQLMTEGHSALLEVAESLWVGIKILLGTVFVLGVIAAVIKVNQMRQTQVIRPGKHGPAQAVVHQGQLVQLQQSMGDPIQNVKMLGEILKVAYNAPRQLQDYLPMPEEYIDAKAEEEELLALPAPQNIPEVIPYVTIANQVPPDQSLLGIYPDNGDLEIVSPENYKTTWFVGGSNLGKTNTVYGKVADMVRWGAKIIISDNHAHKPDSLTNKLSDFHHRLLIPVAQTPEDIKNASLKFLLEFLERKAGKSCDEMWLIVTDEVNATANLPVKVTDEEKQWLLEIFGIKINGNVVKLRVFIQILAETCGYESRGFNMFGFFISQKVAHLAWLRNAMMTVFVHGLLMDSEALLAANNNRALAEQVKAFKKGRTLVYGYEFDPVILQQPLYEMTKQDDANTYPDGGNMEDFHSAPTVDLTAEDAFFRRFNGEQRRAITGSLVKDIEPLEKRLPENFRGREVSTSRPPDEGSPGKSYRLTDAEIPVFLAHYEYLKNIDTALQKIGHGARYQKHASQVLRERGLQ